MSTPTRDTPRGALWWMLWDNYTSTEKDAALDAYRAQCRREAAEEQRSRGDAAFEEADSRGGRTTPCDPKYDKAATWWGAADLIDPDVNP